MNGTLDGRGPLTFGLGFVIAGALLVSVVGIATATGSATGVENVTLYTTEDGADDAVGDIEAVVKEASLRPETRLVVGETLVVEIESERFESGLAERSGTTTERFLAAVEGDANPTLYQTNPTAEIPPKGSQVGPSEGSSNGKPVYLRRSTLDTRVQCGSPCDQVVAEKHGHATRYLVPKYSACYTNRIGLVPNYL